MTDDRRAELERMITPEDLPKARFLISELLFIETQLGELRRLPFLKVDPANPMRQKATPAAKQYKELLQQYNNSLKLLFRISGEDAEAEGESPLRAWLKSQKEGAFDDLDTGQ